MRDKIQRDFYSWTVRHRKGTMPAYTPVQAWLYDNTCAATTTMGWNAHLMAAKRWLATATNSGTSQSLYADQWLDPTARISSSVSVSDVERQQRPALPREFNPYINASDLMEEFIRWLKTQNVRQGEVMQLPIELFIKWLVIRACEQDSEEPNVELVLPAPRRQPHCAGCGRFIKCQAAVPLCEARCANLHFNRLASGKKRRVLHRA